MGMTSVKVRISSPKNIRKREEVEFLVDSGAFYTFADSSILKRLGIEPEDERSFLLANGGEIVRKIGIARFEYQRQRGGAPVVFGEPGDENLLGATALEALGLMLNPIKRVLVPIDLRV